MTPAPEGLLLVDKPAGPTSHDVVDSLRRLLGVRRVGHTGTLDPPATGLLLLLFGRATRLARFVPGSPKVYEGHFRFGLTTTTDDLAGEVKTRTTLPPPAPEAVRAAAGRLLGVGLQVPPDVSARKVAGERLYRIARRGGTATPAAGPIDVTRFEIEATDDPWTWCFLAHVSAGTYVRSLARDLGAALGCGGAVLSLRRTAIGPLSVADALRLDAGGDDAAAAIARAVVPLDRLPLDLARVDLGDAHDVSRFRSGCALDAGPDPGPPGSRAVRDPSGRLLGVGRVEGRTLWPSVVLPDTGA